MTAAPSSLDPTPWAADSLPHAFAALATHTWTMTVTNQEFGIDRGTITVTPWNVDVDIGARRIPIGIARFNLPASVLDAHPDYFAWPTASAKITLTAGWRADDQHPIFQGVITSIEIANGVATIEAETFDGVMAKPCTWPAVPPSYSSLAEVWQNIVRPYFGVSVAVPPLDVIGALSAPSAAQLAAFRNAPMTGMSWIESLNSLALSLGHWLRGSLTGPSWCTLSARYDSGTPLDLTSIIDAESVHHRQSLDDFAGAVVLTANWREGSTAKTSTNWYSGSGGTYVGRYESVPPKTITINYRPPTGLLTDDDPTGRAYATAYYARTWQTTAQGRAIWWLQPRQVVTIAGRTGQLEALKLDVDAGTATYTIRPTSAY